MKKTGDLTMNPILNAFRNDRSVRFGVNVISGTVLATIAAMLFSLAATTGAQQSSTAKAMHRAQLPTPRKWLLPGPTAMKAKRQSQSTE